MSFIHGYRTSPTCLFLFCAGKISVHSFIWGLTKDGTVKFIEDQPGRFVVNWPIAVERYHTFRRTEKEFNKRNEGNNLRGALLNYHSKKGALEYKNAQKLNLKREVIERQFQMPLDAFASLMKKKKEEEINGDNSNKVCTCACIYIDGCTHTMYRGQNNLFCSL